MNTHAKWLTALILVIICSFRVAPASSQTLRAWVAPGGNDANGCTASAPCLTFQGADSKVGSGGEIICLTGGSYGPLTITKSLTIDCEAPGGNAVYGTGGQGSFYIIVAATDRVTLRGLGFDSANRELSGGLVTFAGAGTLVLDHVKINGNNGNGAHGVVFKPNGAARLIVTDSTFIGAGEGASGAGLLVQPVSGGSAQVMLERVEVEANIFGIAADGLDDVGLRREQHAAAHRSHTRAVAGDRRAVDAHRDAGSNGADTVAVIGGLGVLHHHPDRRVTGRRGGDDAIVDIARDHAVRNRHVDAGGTAAANASNGTFSGALAFK
jgi:hypothetical protein